MNLFTQFLISLAICAVFAFAAYGQNRVVGIFENHLDVGDNVKNAGSVTYDDVMQEYTISGSGVNMWYGEDQRR